MTDKQWNELNAVINGESMKKLPIGFIIDCPWLPNWYGISILDYFSNDELWLKANLRRQDWVNRNPNQQIHPIAGKPRSG